MYTIELEDIASSFGLSIHLYADDSQLYARFNSDDVESVMNKICQCMQAIKAWMSMNYLKLNESKTQIICLNSCPSVSNMNTTFKSFDINGNIIPCASEVVNLGVALDFNLCMSTFISNTCAKGYAVLKSLWTVSRSLTYDLKVQLVQNLILTKVDYCNAILYGTTKKELSKLQKLMNASVRFIFNLKGEKYRENIKPCMKKVHFLPDFNLIIFNV